MNRLIIALTLVAATARAETPKFELENNALKLPSPIVYKTGKAELTADSDAAIAHVKAYLDDKTYVTAMRIEVHSDNQGAADTNQKLTEARALAVAKALVGKGIACKRLVPVGFGDTKPIADNRTADGKAQNRRTMFVNAAIKDRAIGGSPLDGGGKLAGDPCK
jgi:OmpA-OmpF porin, OOP family